MHKLNFEYKHGVYPPPSLNCEAIVNGARVVFEKLRAIELDTIGLSEYNRRYFSDLISPKSNLIDSITKYAFILRWAVSDSEKSIKDMTLLDYGGGHGMLSFLAKASGFRTVIHNDIYEQSCSDALAIGREIGFSSDHYIAGDISDVIIYCSSNGLLIDVIANYDVIEHIYDVEGFISKLAEVESRELHVFFGSGANNANPLISYKLKKMHRLFENKDREYKKGRKPTDTTKALVDLRTGIIKEQCATLSMREVKELALVTRGMLVGDIKRTVDEYVSNGTLPNAPLHPTNTCDPYTGNWFEQLLDLESLVAMLQKRDFDAVVRPGFYGASSSGFKGRIKQMANLLISLSWPKGLYLAPYYCLKGIYKNN